MSTPNPLRRVRAAGCALLLSAAAALCSASSASAAPGFAQAGTALTSRGYEAAPALAPGVTAVAPGFAQAWASGLAPGLAVAGAHDGAQVSAINAQAGSVSFLLSAQGLPSGAALDPTTVSVTAGGSPLQATAGALGSAGAAGAAPTRAVYLLLDTSGSMAGAKIAAARAAAEAYLRAIPTDVKVGLIAFSDQPRQLIAPTDDRAAFTSALAGVVANGGTTLYDATATAVRDLGTEGYDATADRRLLILSDGDDTNSTRTLDAVAHLLAADRIPADAVALTPGPVSPALSRLSAAAGGQVLHVVSTAGLSAAFRASARTVSNELLVTAKVPLKLAGTASTLSVSVAVNGQTLTATAPVLFAAGSLGGSSASAAPVLRASAPVSAVVMGGWTLWLVLGVFFASIFLLLGVVLVPVSQRTRRLGQVDAYSRAGRAARAAARIAGQDEEESGSAFANVALGLSTKLVAARGLEERIALDLDRADLKYSPSEWVLLRVCVGFGAVAVFTLLTGNLLIGALLGALVGYVATRVFVSIRVSRRCAAFAERLPDALQLMASSLTSGFSLPQALDALVRQSLPPLAPEFGRALAEARIGVPVEDALTKVAHRMDSQDLRWTVMTMRIQREVGGNLAEVLLTTAETMRERARVRRHVRALAAEGKLSAYVLVALPICIGAWMFLTRGSYVRPLYTTPVGLAMLIGATVLVGLGWVWMLKLAKVEV